MSKEKPNNALTQAIIDCVMATNGKLDDYGQRGALGMARTWLENNKPIVVGANPADKYPLRDKLAVDLVMIFETSSISYTKEQGIAALQAARALVIAPFIDPKVQAERQARLAAGPVGSEKKNEKMGLS